MIRRTVHPAATVSTRRLEAYTDGVFAIAATLLVLDLTTQPFGTVTTDVELWTAIGGMWHPILSFGVSFLLLSLMWMTHVAQFEHIVRLDGLGVWINNARLLFVVLVPFTSSLSTDYEGFLAGRILLPANFFLVILCSWTQWVWAVRTRQTTMPDLPEDDARRQGRGALSALLIAGAAVAASPWVGSLAFLLFFFDGPLTRLLRGSGGALDLRRSRP